MMIPFDYLVDKYKLKISGCLHCGANEGQERFDYDKYIDGEVLWIEAIPSVFNNLKENLIPFPKQIAIKACVSNIDGDIIEFNVSNNESQSSSILELAHHEIIHPEVHYVEKISMQTTRIDTLFRLLERDISKLNFLNLDLQGAELMALQGMGRLINQFDYVLTEVNKKEVYKGCALIEELDAYLYEFERVETGDWVGDSWTDALYIRKTLLDNQDDLTDVFNATKEYVLGGKNPADYKFLL